MYYCSNYSIIVEISKMEAYCCQTNQNPKTHVS